jgi:ribonuclease R
LYKLNAPTLIVIPPRVVHKTEGGPFERHNVNVSPAYLDPFQKEVLDGNYDKIHERYGHFVSEAAQNSSETERNAELAEREVDALYIASYMSEKIGEEYDAVVSGVSNYGIFAEIPLAIEGFIPIETLEDGFECIPERFLLKGKKRSFSIGQEIRVRVEDVDFYERRTKFSLIEEEYEGAEK